MVAMVQRLDARSFFLYPQLSVCTFLALVLKVCWNRFRCHDRSVAELSPAKLSNFGHSVSIRELPRDGVGNIMIVIERDPRDPGPHDRLVATVPETSAYLPAA